MNEDLFTLASMAARYWFCALAALIVFRAWRAAGSGAPKGAQQAGCVGEFVINPGRAKRPKAVPVPREGVLGSGRRSDVCIRDKSVKRSHALLESRAGGLLVRPYAGAKAVLNDQYTGASLFMKDGDTLTIGRLKLLFVSYEPEAATKGTTPPSKAENAREEEDEALRAFEDELWD